MTGQHAQKDQPSWPLVLLALPAFVAIWSGWVGLGQMTGFGKVQPLPGTPLADWTLDTSITLPIGMEVYAAYALRVWLAGGFAPRATRFAKWSAIGSLALGAAGQVAYHLMAAAGVSSAPWWITTVVACLPVAVLGMGAALAHLIRSPAADGADGAAIRAATEDAKPADVGGVLAPPSGGTETATEDVSGAATAPAVGGRFGGPDGVPVGGAKQDAIQDDTGHVTEYAKPQVRSRLAASRGGPVGGAKPAAKTAARKDATEAANVVPIGGRHTGRQARAIDAYLAGEVTSQKEGARQAGVSVRTFQRMVADAKAASAPDASEASR